LGVARWDGEEKERERGIFYALVVMGQGEELALGWVKNYAYDLCITNRCSKDLLKVPKPIDITLQAQQRRMDRVLVLQWCVLLFSLSLAAVFWVFVDCAG